MSVAFDAKSVADTLLSSASSVAITAGNGNNITIGSGTNRYVVFIIAYSAAASGTHVSSAVWDAAGTNQSASAISGAKGQRFPTSGFGNANTVELWGLTAPTSGNKSLTVTMSAACSDIYVAAVSFTSVDQTTPAAHGTGGSGAATPSLTVTSATGNMTVAGWINDTVTIASTSGTQVFIDNNGTNSGAAANRDAGAATVTMTAAPATGFEWGGAAVDIVAAASGSVGTSAGAATVAGQAGSKASSAGAGTASGVAFTGSAGSSAGSSTATGLSGSIGSSAGTSVAAAKAGSLGASSGVGAATGLSGSRGSSVGTGAAAALMGAIAASAGTGTAAGVSLTTGNVGSSAGSALALATAGFRASSSGIALAVGTSGSLGSSAGSGLAAALSGSLGSSAGSGLAAAKSGSIATASSTGTASGVGRSIAAAAGHSSGVGTAHGISTASAPFSVTTLDYKPRTMPQIAGGDYRYLLDELRRVSQSLKTANEAIKQISARV